MPREPGRSLDLTPTWSSCSGLRSATVCGARSNPWWPRWGGRARSTSSSNARAQRYCSRFPEPGAECVDALSVSDWGESLCPRCGDSERHCEVGYAFPPQPLIRPFVKKAIADRPGRPSTCEQILCTVPCNKRMASRAGAGRQPVPAPGHGAARLGPAL